MEALHEKEDQIEKIELRRGATPVLVIFSILPVVVALQTLAVLVLQSVPLPLMGLMLVTIGCCAAFSVLVVDQMLPVKLTLDADGLHVGRTWGSAVYPWHTVDGARVVGSTGTLGDDPTQYANKRFGLGLFLRIGGKEREKDDNPDVVLFAAGEQDAMHLIRMADHINAFRARSGGVKAPVKKIGGATRGMRKKPATA